jgi:multisubunit Na+/H+ antiporter MnhB subunit
VHTLRSLLVTAALSVLAMTIAFGVATARPEMRLSGSLAGIWFAAICAAAIYMLSAKLRWGRHRAWV